MKWMGIIAFFVGILAYWLAIEAHYLIVPTGSGFTNVEWFMGPTVGSIGVLVSAFAALWHMAHRHTWVYFVTAVMGFFLSLTAALQAQLWFINAWVFAQISLLLIIAIVIVLFNPPRRKSKAK